MFSHAEMAMGHPYELPYSVELWDDTDSHVEELIALTGDYRVARAAFEEAVKRWPGRIVTLRQKTRVLAERFRAPTEVAVVALQKAIPSHALLPRWHQALDLRQKVTTENPTAVFVS